MTTLHRWKPGYITEEVEGNEETAKGGWLSPEHIEHFEKRDAMALYRAAKVNGCAERIFHGDRRLEGTPWYDAMEQIVDVNFEYTIDGVTKNLYARRRGGRQAAKTKASRTPGRSESRHA